MVDRQDTQSLLDLKLPPRGLNESIDTEGFGIFDEEIEELRQNILAAPDLHYLEELEANAQGNLLYVAAVDLDDLVADEKHQLQQVKASYKSVEHDVQQRKREIHEQFKMTGKRLNQDYKDKKKKIRTDMKNAQTQGQSDKRLIRKRFDLGAAELKTLIHQRAAESRLRLGKLQEGIEPEIKHWGQQRQKVHVRIELCRAVKDKLPSANFVIFISLWERLGGSMIELSKEHRITKARRHGGRYIHNCLRFEETLELLVPAATKIRPSMAISFEMFMLRTKRLAYDKPVAYGYFPICSSDFLVCQGRFKVPLLKGAIDKKVEKYLDLEGKFNANLDSWLCNLYFQVGLNEAPEETVLKFPDQFEEHHYAVTGPDGLKSRWEGRKRLKYMLGEVFDDLGTKKYKLKSGNLWISVMLLLFSLWLSRLTHYVGQWLFLKLVAVTVSEFEIYWFTFLLEYASNLSFMSILAVLINGFLFSLLIYGVFVGMTALAKAKKWIYPTLAYKLGVLYGLTLLLDPLITLVESIVLSLQFSSWHRDPFLMSIYFEETTDSQFYGPLVTVMFYLVQTGIFAFVEYNYLLYFHMGGRMIDTYHRLSAQESEFLIPYDSEISERYLRWVIRRAHQFKSMSGDVRKVAVLESPDGLKTHIAIYTEGRGRSLLRHFIRLSSGAIQELSTVRFNMFAEDDEAYD